MLPRRSLRSKGGRSKSGTSSRRRQMAKDKTTTTTMSKDQMASLTMATKASGMPRRRSAKVREVLMEVAKKARIQKQNLLQLRKSNLEVKDSVSLHLYII
jgi:hypothetical protein